MTQILRPRETAAMIGVTRSTLSRWRVAGKFPDAIRLGPGVVGWRSTTVEEWIEARENA